MSNAIDDKEMDEYLSGGTQYSQRYRSIPTDDVPVELDQFVLAQANTSNVTSIDAAAEKRTSRTKSLAFWMRISAPVALAASIVLVVSLVIDSGVRYDSTPARVNVPMEDTAMPASSNVSEPEAVAADSAREQRQLYAAPEEKADKAPRDRQSAPEPTSDSFSESVAAAAVAAQSAKETAKKRESPAVAAGAPAPASAPASVAADQRATTELDSVVVTGTFRRSSPEDSAIPVDVISAQEMERTRADSKAGPRNTIPQSAFAKQKVTDEQIAKQQREDDPAAWLTYIRELRSMDKSRDADEEWKRFVKAYPTYPVVEGDSARPKK